MPPPRSGNGDMKILNGQNRFLCLRNNKSSTNNDKKLMPDATPPIVATSPPPSAIESPGSPYQQRHLYIGVPRLDGGRFRLTRCLLGSTLPSAETGRTSPSLLWSIVTAPIAGTFFSLATALLYIV